MKLGFGGPLSLGKVGLFQVEKKRKSLNAAKRTKRGITRVLDSAEPMMWEGSREEREFKSKDMIR